MTCRRIWRTMAGEEEDDEKQDAEADDREVEDDQGEGERKGTSVANTRHNAMFRRFIGALTRGGPGGMPRPIEVHAHDPLRYVGDMLGWLHQALASERELAAALFSHDTSVEKSASRRFSKEGLSSDPSQMEITDMSSVLDRIFEGVCRPFKVRVDQVLTSQPGIVLAYKLSNLLDFYTHTIGELLGERAALMVTLAEVRDTSVRVFYDLMKSKGEKLVKYPPPIAADLSPPPAVGETVSLVLELLDAYKTAMVSAGSKPDFEPVLAALLDPLQQMCERAAEAYGVKTLVSPLQWKGGDSRDSSARRLSGPSPVGGLDGSRHAGHASSDGQNFSNWPSLLPDDSLKTVRRIFLINCYSAIEHPLLPYDVTVARTEALRAVIQEHIATLVEHEVNVILDRCGLATKVEIIQERKVGAGRGMTGRLCDAEEMSAAAVAESARSLFTLLAVEGALPEFVHMQIPRLRADACNKVASALANAYETLYDAVLDPESGYIAAGQLLRHTPGQLRTILGI
ncbi:hypothetical protein CBR_g61503 [Chara braunii]|uniref:Conserved Oligomeric Golgi complex subunit 6 C-terminal domain-containing protein n=1 Tax=Chara braunii TaxID=69332 RepID=A0A388K8T9_CHABU|nr:hypothetical protein CBR_g61503 [Chara braunii]|eukprot:GBG66460.1 hypothetical protein CBR_g61503 [Chara braunii]